MKIIKKISILFALSISFILFFQTKVDAASGKLYLNNLDFEVQINSDGSMDVTEIWDINISNTNTLYKTFRMDSTKFLGIGNVTVEDITNGQEKYLNNTQSWKNHLDKDTYYAGIRDYQTYEISWGVGLDNSRQTRKYKISYKVAEAISKHADYAQLYWQFIGSDFEIDIGKIRGTIYLPRNANTKEDIKVWGHTQDLNGTIYVTDLNKIEFNLNNFNSGGKYVEIRALFPTDMVSVIYRKSDENILGQVIGEETVWANEANQRRQNQIMLQNTITIIVLIVSIIVYIFIIKSIIKDIKYLKSKPKVKQPQELKYFRDIPNEKTTPAQALAIYNMKIKPFSAIEIGNIFSATLLDLNLKKIIEFEEINQKRKIIKIKLLKETADELEEKDEKMIFDFVKKACGKENEITMKDLENYIDSHSSKVEELKKSIDSYVEDKLYQEELANKEEKQKYDKVSKKISTYIGVLMSAPLVLILLTVILNYIVIIAIGLIYILSIIDIIVINLLKSRINVFTKKGIDESILWRGLKHYMEDFSLLNEKEVPQIVLWEKFLVFATVLGIANKVLKQLKIVYPNIDEITNINTYSYINIVMHTNFTSSFSHSFSRSMSRTYSSSIGMGGGFSAGGGGGRRRRSAAGGR